MDLLDVEGKMPRPRCYIYAQFLPPSSPPHLRSITPTLTQRNSMRR